MRRSVVRARIRTRVARVCVGGAASFGAGEVTRKSPGSYLSAKLLFRRASVFGGGISSCRDRVLAAVQLESSAPPSTTPS